MELKQAQTEEVFAKCDLNTIFGKKIHQIKKLNIKQIKRKKHKLSYKYK